MKDSDKILESWQANAKNWIATMENNEIESRCVTNQAIVDAVMQNSPSKILDIGCGEGWLSRSLRENGLNVYGTDGIQELVDAAIVKDGNYYFQNTYEELAAGRHHLPVPFNAIVINFALLDEIATENLIAYLPSLLIDEGYLFIQTLHPLNIAVADHYKSGWKEGSWNGMKQNFVRPYRWYFRTMGDWTKLFVDAGFIIREIREPLHAETGRPLSVIFILKLIKQS